MKVTFEGGVLERTYVWRGSATIHVLEAGSTTEDLDDSIDVFTVYGDHLGNDPTVEQVYSAILWHDNYLNEGGE